MRRDLINISESDGSISASGSCKSIYNFTKVGDVLFSRCGCNELSISHFVLCEEWKVLEVTKERSDNVQMCCWYSQSRQSDQTHVGVSDSDAVFIGWAINLTKDVPSSSTGVIHLRITSHSLACSRCWQKFVLGCTTRGSLAFFLRNKTENLARGEGGWLSSDTTRSFIHVRRDVGDPERPHSEIEYLSRKKAELTLNRLFNFNPPRCVVWVKLCVIMVFTPEMLRGYNGPEEWKREWIKVQDTYNQ